MAKPTFGVKIADKVTEFVGSWRFIIIQSSFLLFWIWANSTGLIKLDPFPFVLLNLLLSFQAAYTGPFVLMSENRQAEFDRERSKKDLETDLAAKTGVEELHLKLDALREQEILQLTTLALEQQETIKRLEQALINEQQH